MKNRKSVFTGSQRFISGSRHSDYQTLPHGALREKWLPAFVVSLFYITLWAPPILPTLASRWYILLGIGIMAYLLNRVSLNLRAANFYWGIYGLGILGAMVSLFRAPSLNLALWNTVGMGINFVALLLMLPTLAVKRTRKLLLLILVGTSILWTFLIQQLVIKHGILAYSTFAETGDNKNAVGYGLALAATSLFYLAAFWRPNKEMQSWLVVGIRLVFGLTGLYLFYNQALIYARGSLLATITGIGVVLVVIFLKSLRKLPALFLIVFLLFFIAIFVFVALPKVLEISPYWKTMYLRATTEGASSVINSRDVLLRKGVYLITQNPFLGVGLGGSRAAISSENNNFPLYLIHNTFLTDWAEKGILGFLADVVWIFAYIKLLKRKYFDLQIVDQIWLLLFIPLIVQMNFKNIGFEVMLAILAGIYYEQYLIDQAKNNSVPAKKEKGC